MVLGPNSVRKGGLVDKLLQLMVVSFLPFFHILDKKNLDHSEALTVDLRMWLAETLKSGLVQIFILLHPAFSKTEAVLQAPIHEQ